MAGRSDPSSPKRAGQQVRKALRTEAWAAAAAHHRVIGFYLGAYLACTAGVAVLSGALGGYTFGEGVLVGLLLGLVPYLGQHFLIGRGISHRSMGADAETWTAAELSKLEARRWSVFHHVPLDRGDIDHVAIGPGRVYAIETKWTARSDIDRFLRGAGGQARRQAQQLESILADRGVHREVRPLLVVWGPGAVDSFGDKPRMVGSTRAVVGANADDWLARMNGATRDRLEVDWPAQQALESCVRGREAS